MDGDLNKIATALIAVFAITFLLLLAQIIFFLTRRQKCVYPLKPDLVEVETAAPGGELEKWRELIGSSRELFTINEEEEGGREGIESDMTPFHTPCGSPPFFTPSPSPSPSPSPTRCADDIPVKKDSLSDEDRTAPFLAIEISAANENRWEQDFFVC